MAYLAINVLMKRLVCRPIQPNQFKSHDPMPAPLFLGSAIVYDPFHASDFKHRDCWSPQAAVQVVWPFDSKWSVDTLPLRQKLSLQCKLRLHVAITSRRKASFILRECWTRSG